MSITRTYETIEECAHLWVHESFDNISDDLVLNQADFFEHWGFVGIDDETGELAPTHEPMWGTYFELANRLDYDWAEENAESIARLGFTLIYRDGELWGLGIDGAGYSFYDAHWIPLYQLRGFSWHEG